MPLHYHYQRNVFRRGYVASVRRKTASGTFLVKPGPWNIAYRKIVTQTGVYHVRKQLTYFGFRRRFSVTEFRTGAPVFTLQVTRSVAVLHRETGSFQFEINNTSGIRHRQTSWINPLLCMDGQVRLKMSAVEGSVILTGTPDFDSDLLAACYLLYEEGKITTPWFLFVGVLCGISLRAFIGSGK